MKKRVKKLVVSKETVRILDDPALNRALGEATTTNAGDCTNDTTQTTGYCPSAGCVELTSDYCPSNRVACRR